MTTSAWWSGDGPVTQGYRPGIGYEPDHTGIDYGLPSGTPLFAGLAGWLDELTNPGGFGIYSILHPDQAPGTEIILGHQSAYNGPERHVGAGELIGYSGSTGWSTGPHLHLEERVGAPAHGYGGRDVNPSELLAGGLGGPNPFDALPPDVRALLGLSPGLVAAGALGNQPGQLAGAAGAATAQAFNAVSTGIGHGLADAIGVGLHDATVFIQRQIVALAVAAVVLLVIFA